MKRQSWAALTTTGLLLAYGCAEPEPLGSVFIRDLSAGAGAADGGVDPGAGGTGPGQGGTGPAPGTGGTGGTGAAPGTGGTGAAPSTGGTGGAAGGGGTGGAPGAGGTGTGGTASTPAGNCVETGDISVFYTETANATTQNIRMTLALLHQGDAAAFTFSDLVLRYWFGDDGLGGFVGQSFYAQAAQANGGADLTANVTTTFGEELGSAYIDIGFNSNANIGAGIQQLQMDIHSDPYANWDQSNDFSFVADANNVVNENITVFVDGEQVFGCTPPAQ
jgi:hypothetical protein